jgi:hypothetical protein
MLICARDLKADRNGFGKSLQNSLEGVPFGIVRDDCEAVEGRILFTSEAQYRVPLRKLLMRSILQLGALSRHVFLPLTIDARYNYEVLL